MGSETAMQVSQILIKSTESKSTIWSMIGVIILLVGSTAVCGVTKSLNLIWHVEVLPKRNIHYPARLFIWINISYRFLLLVSLISTGLSSIAN
jgi:membrane protein